MSGGRAAERRGDLALLAASGAVIARVLLSDGTAFFYMGELIEFHRTDHIFHEAEPVEDR